MRYLLVLLLFLVSCKAPSVEPGSAAVGGTPGGRLTVVEPWGGLDLHELPTTLRLSQILKSSELSEEVSITFRMEKRHNLYFEGGEKMIGPISRRIAGVETPTSFALGVFLGEGEEVDSFSIYQDVTDNTGRLHRGFDQVLVVTTQ